MRSDELWMRVGRRLAAARVVRGFESPWQHGKVHREPTPPTIEAIEAGRPGNVGSLDAYAEALGLSLPAVLLEVLSESDVATLPIEIQAVVDALALHDEAQNPLLSGWQAATKMTASAVLRQAQRRREPTAEPSDARRPATRSNRAKRGTRKARA